MSMRDRILQACAQVVLEKGFDRASVREIARTAGVAVGTLYLYFPNKEGLLDAFVQTLSEDAAAASEAASQVRDRAALEKFLAERIEFLSQNQGILRAVIGRAVFDASLAQKVAERVVEPALKALKAAAQKARVKPPKNGPRLCWQLMLASVVMAPIAGTVPTKSIAAAAAQVLTTQ
ncbi:MAG: TetR/AcrR family transcriptional regulator [Armatimonadetes bacterium]|nr:TetR/AcrR family transcriptional regulator [Armatimonadota bacterium]